MTRALYPYQHEGVKFLAGRTRALLADSMGIGKSAQAVAAAREAMMRRGHEAVGSTAFILVVCPASLTANWRREFDMWWGWRNTHDYHLNVVSYDKLARDPGPYTKEWDVVILDEAHYLKNPKAKRTQAVFGPKTNGIGGVIEKARHVWALTGTPAPNNPSELWPMLHAMAPGTIIPKGTTEYTPMNHFRFTRRYCVMKNNGFAEVIVRGQRLDELKERMAPFVLRRRKEEVLKDLPELRFGELPLESASAAKALAGLDQHDVTNLKAALEMHGVEGLAKMSTEMASLRRVTALAKAGAVAEWAKEWLNDCDDKIVIFGWHRDALALLEESLSGYGAAGIDGGTSQRGRADAVERFQRSDDCRVFIGQIQAAGTGITLTAASDLIFLEQSWTPADNAQAAMRIHRIGQKRGCLVRTAMLAGSIDEAVQRVLARKTEDLVQLFDAVA